jgi:hypothetical protein
LATGRLTAHPTEPRVGFPSYLHVVALDAGGVPADVLDDEMELLATEVLPKPG